MLGAKSFGQQWPFLSSLSRHTADASCSCKHTTRNSLFTLKCFKQFKGPQTRCRQYTKFSDSSKTNPEAPLFLQVRSLSVWDKRWTSDLVYSKSSKVGNRSSYLCLAVSFFQALSFACLAFCLRVKVPEGSFYFPFGLA